MKKILPLTLLAVAAVFLLSSCDSMLEALFPKDTIGTNTGNSTITFQISGWDYNYDQFGYVNAGLWSYEDPATIALIRTYANSTIYVELYDNSSTLVPVATQTTAFTGLGGFAARTANVTFPGLRDGSYTFKVWYDAESDSKPELEQGPVYNGWYFTRSATTPDNAYVSSQYVQGEQSVQLIVDLFEYPDPSVN